MFKNNIFNKVFEGYAQKRYILIRFLKGLLKNVIFNKVFEGYAQKRYFLIGVRERCFGHP